MAAGGKSSRPYIFPHIFESYLTEDNFIQLYIFLFGDFSLVLMKLRNMMSCIFSRAWVKFFPGTIEMNRILHDPFVTLVLQSCTINLEFVLGRYGGLKFSLWILFITLSFSFNKSSPYVLL